MAILKITKEANLSQKAATKLQEKLVNTLMAKLPKKLMTTNQKAIDYQNEQRKNLPMKRNAYERAREQITKLIDKSNYKGAREYVAKQLQTIKDQGRQ